MKESIKSYKNKIHVFYILYYINESSVVYDLHYFTSLNVHETNESSYQFRDIIYLKTLSVLSSLEGSSFSSTLESLAGIVALL